MKGKKKEKGKKRRLYGIKTAAVIVATVMAASSTAVPAFASATKGPAEGGKTTFDKYLIMKNNANVPNATFSYKVTPADDEIPTDTNGTNLTVRKGIGTPTASSTEFKAGDQTFDKAQTVRTNSDSKTYDEKTADPVPQGLLDEGYKYAKHTSTVDFTGITFNEPGVYRYKVKEITPETKAEKEKGVSYDPFASYLDVYVESDEYGQLSIQGYVFHTNNEPQKKGSKNEKGEYDTSSNPAGKNQGFVNFYDTKDLTLTKTVTGNQGFRDQYFKFHVDITNLDGGSRLFLTDKDGNKSYTSKDTVPYEYNAETGTRTAGQKRFVAEEGMLLKDIDSMTPSVFTIADAGTKGKTVKETVGTSTKENVPDDAKGLAITANDSGHVTFDVYLKHGESLKVNGLTEEAKYTITETSNDYTATATKTVTRLKLKDDSGGARVVEKAYVNHGVEAMALNATAGTNGASVTPTMTTSEPDEPKVETETTTETLTTDNGGLIHNQDNHTDATATQTLVGDETVAFTNDREGTLPTGIYHNNRAIFNIIGIAAIGSAIAIVIRKRRKEKE